MQLSIMVEPASPSPTPSSPCEQSFSETFGTVIKQVVQMSPARLSSVLENYPRISPSITPPSSALPTLRTMGAMLRKLADYLVSQRETTKKVKGALIYPGSCSSCPSV